MSTSEAKVVTLEQKSQSPEGSQPPKGLTSTSRPPARCELYEPSLLDVIYIARDLPDDEVEQTEKFSQTVFDPESVALWFWGTQFKIGCRTKDGIPIAVCGFTPTGPNVWRTFFLASNLAWKEHGKELTEYVITGMYEIVAREGIRRLETLCLKSRKRAQAWYKRLGLEYESTLKNFCGEDAVMFTMIVET